MIVCHSEHSFCTDFSVLELYLADSGKNSRSSGYSMHTENLHTMRSIHTACCRNGKSSMIVWHFEHSLYLETKMLNSLSHILVIWVFHSFSRRKVIAFFCQLLVIPFSQTAVTNIYFGSYFICSIQTKIVINSSLFRPNQLSIWEIWIKDWIWKNWYFLVERQIKLIFQIQQVYLTSIHLFNIFCWLTFMTQIGIYLGTLSL